MTRIVREVNSESKEDVRRWRHNGKGEGLGGFRVRSRRRQNPDGTRGERIVEVSVRQQNIDSPRVIED